MFPSNASKVAEVLLRPHRHLYELQKSSSLLLVDNKNRNPSTKSAAEFSWF